MGRIRRNDLKTGAGNAWAGHSKLMGARETFLTPIECDSDEKRGPLLLVGSARVQRDTFSITRKGNESDEVPEGGASSLPEDWRREGLSRAQ